MQPYDLFFLAMLAISCFSGLVRGAVKELVNLISFFLALFISVVTKSSLSHAFNLDTVTGYIAAFILFIAIYFALRYLGHALSDKVRKQQALNLLDRVLGVGIGILRTLIVLGVIHLIFCAVFPIERLPHWFRDAKVYPLSVKCAKTIQAFTPQGTEMADKLAPEVQK